MKTNSNKSHQQQSAPQDIHEGGTASLPDNRSSTCLQRKLQQMMNDRSSTSPIATHKPPVQRKENKTPLPGHLKSGIETLSGYSMDDVTVHYNSDKPVQMQAHAYAMGSAIYMAPGQEKHLPHEAWHIVQQKQGRVKPTMQFKGNVFVNDDAALEKEADVMGEKALSVNSWVGESGIGAGPRLHKNSGMVMQRKQKKSAAAKVGLEIETTLPVRRAGYGAIPEKNVTGKPLPVEHKHIQRKRLLEIINTKHEIGKTNMHKVMPELQELLDALLKDAEKDKEAILAYMTGDALEPDNVISRIVTGLTGGLNQFHLNHDEVVHIGEDWKAVAEKIPATVSGLSSGLLLSNAGVEIVTNPVNDIEEAETIMKSINVWLREVTNGIYGGKERTYTEGDFAFEIPDKMSHQLLVNGRLKGNIQVNIGATLEDVISVFKENGQDVKVDRKNNRTMAFKKAIELFGSDELWISVLEEFDALKKADMPQKSKRKQADYEIEPADEPYIRNIMFQYLYMGQMHTVKSDDASIGKNLYPILIKTPVDTQAELSDWANYRLKWVEKNNYAATKFRSRFASAVRNALEKNNKKLTKDPNISHALRVIGGHDNDKKFKNGNEIFKREDLSIGTDKYAGVFEIRYLQNTAYLQDQWLDVWKAYLNAGSHNVPLPATNAEIPTAGVVRDQKDQMAVKFDDLFKQHIQKAQKDKKKKKRIRNPFRSGH